MNILFCGPGYCAGNFGDDAILAGALRSARSTLDNDTKYGAIIYSNRFSDEKLGLDISFQYPSEVDAAFSWASLIILGGASLIGAWGIPRCAELILKAKKLKKRICMIGVGVSDLGPKRNLDIIKSVFGYLDLISVRSDFDREQAILYGIHPDKLFVSGDLAFAAEFPKRNDTRGNLLGVNLVDEKMSLTFSYADNMRRFLLNYKDDILFLCGDIRKENILDYGLLSDLASYLKKPLFCKYLTYIEFLDVLKSCNLVITMRMHMMIFCAVLGIPCVPIAREMKTFIMASYLGVKEVLTLNGSYNVFEETLNRCLLDPESLIVSEFLIDDIKEKSFMKNGFFLKKAVENV